MAFLTVVAGWRLPAQGSHMEIPPTVYSKNFNMETHPNLFLYTILWFFGEKLTWINIGIFDHMHATSEREAVGVS